METLQDNIRELIAEQMALLQYGELTTKERIDLICRLMPYVAPKKAAERDAHTYLEDPLAELLS
jgi:hypothetical protein